MKKLSLSISLVIKNVLLGHILKKGLYTFYMFTANRKIQIHKTFKGIDYIVQILYSL